MDFTDYGCVVIVVMTHGDENGLLMAKDEQYSELEILQYFKHREKPKLVTKPVVVIIQVSLDWFDSNVDALRWQNMRAVKVTMKPVSTSLVYVYVPNSSQSFQGIFDYVLLVVHIFFFISSSIIERLNDDVIQ